jgi:RNA polymerase sigma factor (TIGR02999 family)
MPGKDVGGGLSSDEGLLVVYEELRRLAARWLAKERPGQTLDATALVHEAYLRLVGPEGDEKAATWGGRAHFFAAAAEAMRRILVERARRKRRAKHGGGKARLDVSLADLASPVTDDDLLALDEALEDLGREDPVKRRIVTLRYFGGMTAEETATVLGVTRVTVQRKWAYAKAWLHRRLRSGETR